MAMGCGGCVGCFFNALLVFIVVAVLVAIFG